MPKYECDNCEYKTENDDEFKHWNEIHHLGERLDIGGIVPAGECPHCLCLVYLTENSDSGGDDSKTRLMNWLSTIPDGTKIYIDDDGICIRALGTDAYYELGGHTPDDENDDEETERPTTPPLCSKSTLRRAANTDSTDEN